MGVLKNRLESAILYALGAIGLRNEDVLLSSYPRSGSTWIRLILCNLISLREWDGRHIDFSILNDTMVELGVSNLLNSWSHSTTIPRVVKTHLKYNPLFYRNRVIGLVRDPRDIMVSFYHYKKDRMRDFAGSFQEFLRHPDFGLMSWFEHYTSWRDRWTLVVRYEDMREDTYGEIRKILDSLGAGDLPEHDVRAAIRRSDIGNVRRMDEHSDRLEQNAQAVFARSGRTRQWTNYFSDEDLRHFSNLLQEYDVGIYDSDAVKSLP